MAEHTLLLADPDTALSKRVEAALTPYGCRCVILSDANEVLSYPHVPSLIVLCIDPKRLGWAICMRVKKHPVLKGVPLIITSAEATEKDFEEHARLKTRAEEYEHKPLAVERLVDKVRALLGGLEVQVSGEWNIPASVEELSADDAIEIEADGALEDSGASTRVGAVADRLGTDTAEAFSAIAAVNAELAAAPEPVTPTVHASHAAPPAAPPVQPPPPEHHAEPPAAGGLAARALDEEPPRKDSGSLELEAMRGERDRLLGDLEALRTRPAPTSGATSPSRELLGLREVINRKEKEIFDLKDALDGKDREVRDRLREGERARRELDERLLEREKELITLQEGNEALVADEELGRERERGMKARLDEAQQKAARAETELEQLRAHHDVERAEATRAADALRETHAGEKAALDAAHEAAVAGLKAAHDEALAGANKTHDSRLSELREGHTTALAEKDESHKQALLAAEGRGREELERAAEGHAAALAAQTTESEQALAAMAERHATELAALRAEHEAATKQQAAERATDAAERQRHATELTELQGAVAQKEQRLAALEDEVLKAFHRIKSDEVVVARARKALAIALTLLDDSLPKVDENKSS